jgi:hypothetical protein
MNTIGTNNILCCFKLLLAVKIVYLCQFYITSVYLFHTIEVLDNSVSTFEKGKLDPSETFLYL